MNNPFRKVLDTELATHKMKLPYYGKPLKNIIICYETDLTDVDLQYLFHQYQEVHPELCEEKADDGYEQAMKFLEDLAKKRGKE